jgi:hypothetical protein
MIFEQNMFLQNFQFRYIIGPMSANVHYNKNMTIFHEKYRDIFIATCCFRVVLHDNAV